MRIDTAFTTANVWLSKTNPSLKCLKTGEGGKGAGFQWQSNNTEVFKVNRLAN